jgi:hypothetical protein
MVQLKECKIDFIFNFALLIVRPCGSVVEHTLGKGEVTSSILVTGFS